MEGGRRLDLFEKDFDMWGEAGCLGDGGSEFRLGLLPVGVGLGSNVSLRGETVGSSNSNAKVPGEVGAGMTGEVVIMVGGLAFLASVGESPPLDEFGAHVDVVASDGSMGEAASCGLCLSAGEVVYGRTGETPSIEGDRLPPISGVSPSDPDPCRLFFVPKLFFSQFVALPIRFPPSSTS